MHDFTIRGRDTGRGIAQQIVQRRPDIQVVLDTGKLLWMPDDQRL
jgi:hypothetical protein